MPHPAQLRLLDRLVAQLGGAVPANTRVGEIPAWHYTAPARFEAERAGVFARLPQVVAADAELAAPGACLSIELAGVPLLVVRGGDGVVRGFRNACRHRGTRLVPLADAPCATKAFVCPYHAWTYDLAGKLLHVPHAETFQGRGAGRDALVPVPVAVRDGLVWAGLEPFDLAAYLAPIDGELAELAQLHFYRRRTREVRANWKLILDAFLDGYHIRHLHRNSIYRFFLDARAELEPAGPHVRSLVGRRALAEVAGQPVEVSRFRELASPSYVLFPNTVLVFHPDYLSVLVSTPLAEDRTRFVHIMLVPEPPERHAEHWAKSFTLIDEGVFGAEDLMIVEEIQRGLAAGVDDTVLFGTLECAALGFHESVASQLAR